MEVNEIIQELHNKLTNFSWYAQKIELNPNLYNSLVVYVYYFSDETVREIPDRIGKYSICAHFAISSDLKYRDYIEMTNLNRINSVSILAKSEPIKEPIEEISLPADLRNQLWQLTRICGKDVLKDIFYEAHDADDAITNFSEEYPEVRAEIQKLYDTLGFDLLFEEFSQ